jgi:hypothetical protein
MNADARLAEGNAARLQIAGVAPAKASMASPQASARWRWSG